MNLTIRARLTLLYFVVLAASFAAFFWICDFGFLRSIEITVNDASQTNLERVRAVIGKALPEGIPKVQRELAELSELWASGALFEVAGPDGRWIFRSSRFLKPLDRLVSSKSDSPNSTSTPEARLRNAADAEPVDHEQPPAPSRWRTRFTTRAIEVT